MSEDNQQFDTFEEWVNKASSWLTRRGQFEKAVCFDTKGRACQCGGDFERARDEGAFPIRYLWPDQVAALVPALQLSICRLSAREPGDSRAVSDEFVALACVENGDVRPEVLKIINDALDVERAKMKGTDLLPKVWIMRTATGWYPIQPSTRCRPEDHGQLNPQVVQIEDAAGNVLWRRSTQ